MRCQMNIEPIDHVVLTVADIEATCSFYSQVPGMHVTSFGGGRKALSLGVQQQIKLHQYGKDFEPKAKRPTPGSADLCFITAVPVLEVIEQLRAHGVGILEGPVRRTGAAGAIMSGYFRDPDGNLIEVSNCEKA